MTMVFAPRYRVALGHAHLLTLRCTGCGGNVQIGGFIIRGDQGKKAVVRAISPSLARSGVTGVFLLPSPPPALQDAHNPAPSDISDRAVFEGGMAA
jgi:hypothetical protein